MGRDDVILGATCIGQDITQMKELDVKRSNIAATVTHELRSPLHGIIGLSEQLISTGGDERQKRLLIMISHCARRLLDLVTNIMDVSTLVQSKRMLLARDPVHMGKLIEEVLVLLSTAVDKAKKPVRKDDVQLIINVPDQLPIIEADANRCMQMLYNLVTNAFKYTKEGTVEVSASADDEKEILTVRIRDTGIGISPAACERIFLPFEQEDQHDNRRYEGLGLGLAISREVAVKHGGNLTVESQVGEGSTFSITLPYKRQVRIDLGSSVLIDEEEENHPCSADQEEAPETEAEKTRAVDLLSELEGSIWVVDDDRDARRSIKEVLKTYSKVNVVECESSYACMSMMEAGEHPQMIILDTETSQSMQGSCHLVRWIRSRCSFSKLPIVVVSSNPAVRAMLEAVKAGCNEWMAKPFKAEELVARISLSFAAAKAANFAEVQGDPVEQKKTLSNTSPSARSADSQSRRELVEGALVLSSSSMPPMPSYDNGSDDEAQSSLSSSSDADEGRTRQRRLSSRRSSTDQLHVPNIAFKRFATPESKKKKTVTVDVDNKVSPSEKDKGAMPVAPQQREEQVPQQMHQQYSLECYRLLGRLLPGRAVERLIKGETVEPEKFHGAVLVAYLQGLDALAMANHAALGNFLDTLHTWSTSENIMLLPSAEHLVAVTGFDGPQGHETQLARFALALEERFQALRVAILPSQQVLSVSCGIDMGEICQLALGHLHPQVWIAGNAMFGARRLCKAASQCKASHVFVSPDVLQKIRPALPSLSVNPMDVNTGALASSGLLDTLNLQGNATAEERGYALLRPNEVLDFPLQKPEDTKLLSLPSPIPLEQANLEHVSRTATTDGAAAGGPAASVYSQSPRGASVTSRGSQALRLQAQHLHLDNQLLRQRCQALESRSQQLQRSYWQLQQMAEEAQAEVRRSQWETNFWRQLGQR